MMMIFGRLDGGDGWCVLYINAGAAHAVWPVRGLYTPALTVIFPAAGYG